MPQPGAGSMHVTQGHLLIVDDDAVLRAALDQWLRLSGFTTTLATDVPEALSHLERLEFDAVLTDLRMPGEDGLSLLRRVQARWPGLPLILLTGHGDVPQAVEAIRHGAYDFLTKPHDPDRLAITLRNACEHQRLQRRIEGLAPDAGASDPVARRLVGRSQAMARLKVLARNGGFRDDLYYRLAGFELDIPPLRERDEDILLLFQRFAAQAAQRAGQAPPPLAPMAAAALLEHSWPGNVRELRLVAERFGLGLGLQIEGTCRTEGAHHEGATGGRPSLEVLLEAYERKLILAALQESGGSVARAMVLLNVPRRMLNDKMQRLGIQRPRES